MGGPHFEARLDMGTFLTLCSFYDLGQEGIRPRLGMADGLGRLTRWFQIGRGVSSWQNG